MKQGNPLPETHLFQIAVENNTSFCRKGDLQKDRIPPVDKTTDCGCVFVFMMHPTVNIQTEC